MGALKTAIILAVFMLGACNEVVNESPQVPVSPFPLAAVKLLDSPFKHAEEVNLNYLLALEPDRLLAPFLKEAGLKPKADSYGNWESSGLDGHIGGHYVSALSLMYASTGNQNILDRLNYMLSELKRCQDQDENGYMGGIPGGKAMWKQIAVGQIDAASFSLNGKWVPWYNIHKLYAGLYDAYHFTGNELAKEMLIKLTDWCVDLVSALSDDQVQQMLRSEHGGMNEVFANVAAITGDEKYLQLAKKFSHRVILDPLLIGEDKLTGLHANTQIPKVIGFKRIADIAGDTSWDEASKFFWEAVVTNRSVSIGGNSVREHFHPADDFHPMISDREGPETCNTYNMMRLSNMLYQSTAATRYIDYYEKAMYNHILSSQHPKHGGLVYFTSMRPQHYRVYSQSQKCFWCCVGSGIENHGKYGELIYARSDNSLYVNLFIPSELTWQEKGLVMVQNTGFPYDDITLLTLNLEKPEKFSVKIRYPSWVEQGAIKVEVNEKNQRVRAIPGEYIELAREWKSGDKIKVRLPMKTRLERLPDGSDFYSVLHGPVVLAVASDTTGLVSLIADDSRMGHVASGPIYPLEEAPFLIGNPDEIVKGIKPVEGHPLTFSANNVLFPEQYKNLLLTPFFKVHDARYVIYFRQSTTEGYKQIQEKIRELQRESMELEKRTIDFVTPGQQQPESDHFFKGENTETGVHMNRHWRHARGWFSYNMTDKNKEAALLQVTYSGQDRDRVFDITINNQLIATVNLEGSRGNDFYSVSYPIPAHIVENAPGNVLVVKFAAHPGSIAGGVYDVRLLRE